MIVEYIKKVIEENFIKSKEQNVIGKFILRNYSRSPSSEVSKSSSILVPMVLVCVGSR